MMYLKYIEFTFWEGMKFYNYLESIFDTCILSISSKFATFVDFLELLLWIGISGPPIDIIPGSLASLFDIMLDLIGVLFTTSSSPEDTKKPLGKIK